MLAVSINREEVEALYEAAQLELDDDLERLASEPRIAADPAALAYLEQHLTFNGDLGGIPVLTVHTDGDGLVTPDNERAYADIVHHAGQAHLLRQLYVHRGGHCTFTPAEVLTALRLLIERIETGSWPDLDPRTLNDAAARLGAESNTLESGEATDSGFFQFEPAPFPRPYDVRHLRSR